MLVSMIIDYVLREQHDHQEYHGGRDDEKTVITVMTMIIAEEAITEFNSLDVTRKKKFLSLPFLRFTPLCSCILYYVHEK